MSTQPLIQPLTPRWQALRRALARPSGNARALAWHAALPLLAALLCAAHALSVFTGADAPARSAAASTDWPRWPTPAPAEARWQALRAQWPGLKVLDSAQQAAPVEQLSDYQLIALMPSPRPSPYALLQKRAPTEAGAPAAAATGALASTPAGDLIRRGLGESIAGYTVVAVGPRSLRVRKGDDEQVIPIFKPEGTR